ncbi:MAG: MFS transporter [Cyclobacteriaceae bacterium]
MKENTAFTNHQVAIIIGLACLLFTVVLDYMLLPALSSTLLTALDLSTEEFGLIASAYAISAGISAFVASGYADRFGRKPFLLFFYAGFLLGLLLCALAPSFELLLAARTITGAFGGVVASITYALVTDMFPLQQRARVMGWLQSAFATSLVLGLPLALYISATFSWQLSYWLVLSIGGLALVMVNMIIKPQSDQSSKTTMTTPWEHAYQTIAQWKYWTVFTNNTLIVGGDIILMTFNATYMINNLGLTEEQLPFVYGAMGLTSMISSPILGKLADRYGSLLVFIVGTLIAMVSVVAYANVPVSPMWIVIALHIFIFIGINARMVTSVSLATAIPGSKDRGSFMAIDASVQQLAGGLAAAAAGFIVIQATDGHILNFPQIGWIVVSLMCLSAFMMYRINLLVNTA